jgi:hypothetical protein
VSNGRFYIDEGGPFRIVSTVVVLQGADWVFSLRTTRAADQPVDCSSRIDEPQPDRLVWVPVTVRRVEGCGAVNDAGWVFIEWRTDDWHYHADGSLDLTRALSRLESWEEAGR